MKSIIYRYYRFMVRIYICLRKPAYQCFSIVSVLIGSLSHCVTSSQNPAVSIITSVYNADYFIESFLQDITQQSIFDTCELILINAHSPGHEERVIESYLMTYPNIIYVRLDHDPGLYAVWNYAIRIARGRYITNANVDDRLRKDCYELHMKTLDANGSIDLVYSDFYVTYEPNKPFDSVKISHVRCMPDFSIAQLLRQPLPNNHPMWRKSLHERCGFFDETFRYAGDWEFWLRAADCGAVFEKVPGILGLYYYNPRGLSTDVRHASAIAQEEHEIKIRYRHLDKSADHG